MDVEGNGVAILHTQIESKAHNADSPDAETPRLRPAGTDTPNQIQLMPRHDAEPEARRGAIHDWLRSGGKRVVRNGRWCERNWLVCRRGTRHNQNNKTVP